MELEVIGTGSAGNLYVLRAGERAIMLDAGVAFIHAIRKISELRDSSVLACLITHEHADHSQCVGAISRLGVQIITSKGTAEALHDKNPLVPFVTMRSLEVKRVGQFIIMPFDTQHDAAEPFGFLIRYEPTGETLLYATDTYYLKYRFPGVNYWVVECNYCDDIMDDMQNEGSMTPELRKRLKRSHMSLDRLIATLNANDLTHTRKIVLVHLSDERSDEKAMVNRIRFETTIDAVAATNGAKIPLELAPF